MNSNSLHGSDGKIRIACRGKGMNDQQYFRTTSLSYQLKAAQRELASFRSGEAYAKMRADYESIIRDLNMTIKKLRRERDDFSFSCKEITRQWMDVLEDVQKEHEKENQKLKRVIAELLDTRGLILKLTAQVNHDYENSSLPSSKCVGRKKITNNRERTGTPASSAQAHETGQDRGDTGRTKTGG